MPAEPDSLHSRRGGLWALVAMIFVALAVLWVLAFIAETPTEEAAPDPTTSTTVATTTTAAPTTGAPASTAPTTTERYFVEGTASPVLGEDVDGMLVKIGFSRMHQLDLATGEITVIELEHTIPWGWGPPPGVIVDGKVVHTDGQRLLITDLSNGAQAQGVMIENEPSELVVVGRASADSVWLSKGPWEDGVSAAVEVGLDGNVRRRVDLPPAFWVLWADGDDLVLESPEGLWRYDTLTGTADRMPGGIIDFRSGLAIMMACNETLSCEVLADTGNGPAVIDWLDPNELDRSEFHVSPDRTGVLLHGYPEEDESDIRFSYIDLRTGSRRDLGQLEIHPWAGISWIADTGWIVAESVDPNSTLVVIDTTNGDRVPIDLGPNSQGVAILTYLPPSRTDESVQLPL